MSNEELFDTSSEIFDTISDSSADTEADPVAAEDPEQGSDESAVTPVDTSSVYTVVVDQREVIEELKRIEGYSVSILYTLYICLGVAIGIILIKIINYYFR